MLTKLLILPLSTNTEKFWILRKISACFWLFSLQQLETKAGVILTCLPFIIVIHNDKNEIKIYERRQGGMS